MRKEALLFFEKKRSKKNFATLDRAGFTATGPFSKSFLLLFFKKEALSSLPLRALAARVNPVLGQSTIRPAAARMPRPGDHDGQ
jgi:hypothetical protein